MHPAKYFFVLLVFCIACNTAKKVDTIVHNGTVYTVDKNFSTVQAFAVADGKIVATGTNKEILDNYSAKEMIDAGGRAVYPGFIDAHAHFLGYGQSLFAVDLFGTTSWDEVVE